MAELGASDRAALDALLERCTFPGPGTAVTCAVSGGCDSSALLVLAVAAGLSVTAVHVDHGLRAGSIAEADVVRSLADRFGAGFRAVTAPVAPGPDLEARARAVRHDAVGPDALFGHTADDQAETVLLRLLRGTGPSGLAAMRDHRHPMLALRRRETRELCRRLAIAAVDDPTNRSSAHTRNRVRHEVVPLLADVAGRDVVPLLCRLAEQSGAQADLIGQLAAAVDATDVASLAAAPGPVAVAALRRWWIDATGGPPPDAAAVARMLDVARGTSVGCDVVGGWRVLRTAGRLRLVPPTSS